MKKKNMYSMPELLLCPSPALYTRSKVNNCLQKEIKLHVHVLYLFVMSMVGPISSLKAAKQSAKAMLCSSLCCKGREGGREEGKKGGGEGGRGEGGREGGGEGGREGGKEEGREGGRD